VRPTALILFGSAAAFGVSLAPLPHAEEELVQELSAPPVATSAAVTPSKSPDASAGCDLSGDGALFVDALHSFRAGDERAWTVLAESSTRLEERCGRSDPRAIAEFYASLTAEERERGLQLEREFDALHELAADLPAGDATATEGLHAMLAEFLQSTEECADLPVRAHALSLDVRFAVRPLEQNSGEPVTSRKITRIEERAQEAVELFQQAGQVTPTLEPRWTLARCALLRSDWNEAEVHFSQLEDLAHGVGRHDWRERGLLGLIGLARERGSLFAIDGLLEELASFRDPKTSWALSREVAVQMIQRGYPGDALDWLLQNPPSELDGELEGAVGVDTRLSIAMDQWRSFASAAAHRSGDPDWALDQLAAVSASGSNPMAALTRALIHLESGDAAEALLQVRQLSSMDTGPAELIDRWTLEGRALLALGRPREAIEPLERALALTRNADLAAGTRERGRLIPPSVQNGSRVGECLGLSAIETLGRAYAELGDPLRAAALFEWIHAPTLSREECRAEILALSSTSSLGYVTWVVGADTTLAVHVAPSGAAEALPIQVGRNGVERGVQRFRDALRSADQGTERSEWRAVGQELSAALLPMSLRKDLEHLAQEADDRGPRDSLVLSPHGPLERLPFEALPLARSRPPLGVAAALTVLASVRGQRDVAEPLEGPTANWVALGAPSTERFDDLPGAQRELESIGRLQPRWTSITGAQMTRLALESALQGARPLHLATHVAPTGGGLDGGIAPMGFVVAGDDIVSAREVLALGPRLPLAVLTACGSAEGVSVDGLSVRGLAQTMLACGTNAAIVTLWPIDDRAGELASVRIHAALIAGANPSEATRRAREFLWKLGERPSEWAAYRHLR
jgi:CHAT domain-containing protein